MTYIAKEDIERIDKYIEDSKQKITIQQLIKEAGYNENDLEIIKD